MRLHPWKQDFIARAQQAPGNVLVVAPTGSGKTVVAVHLMRGRTLFIAHRRELIAQAEKRCRQWGVDTSNVTIVSKQSLERRKLPDADVVIFDEAHHVPSKGWARIHQHYREQGAKIYGLTATPVRLDGKGLAPFFDTIVQAPPTSELAAAGYIVVPRVFVPKGRIDLREVRVKNRDFDAKSLDAAVRKVVGSIVGHWRERAEGRQTVVYAVSVAHAEAIAAEFVHAGVTAEVIHGKLRVDARDAMLARFDAGTTRVLVNCEILTEGWDCPAAKCVVLARPTLSFGLLMQMMGRITRPNGEAPIVLDLADNCRYFDKQGFNPIGDLTYSLESDYPIGAGCSTLRRCSTCGELVTGGCWCSGPSRPIPEVIEGDLEVWYPSRGLTDAQIDECVRRYLAGESAELIANSMGVGKSTVFRALHSRGVQIRPSQPAALTEAQINECVRRYLAGESAKSIAKAMGVSDMTVLAALRSRGVQIRPSQPVALTDAQIDDAVKRYLAGESAMTIAKAMGVNVSTVLRSLRSRGVQIRQQVGLTDAQIDDAVKRYLAGESAMTIAKAMGVGSTTVRRALVARGVTIRQQVGLTEAQIDECVQRYLDGESATAIAKSMGVSPDTVLKELRSRGVQIRPSSRSVAATLTSKL